MSGVIEKPITRRSETSSTYTRRHDMTTARSHSDFADCDHCTQYPNRWSKIRAYIREPAAEFFGTMILVIFGCGSNCQVGLSSNPAVASSPKGEYLSTSFGWAVGIGLGIWTCASISGGHINPAVTLALASIRKFPWKKVPSYILAQFLGAMCGAGIIYANYYHAISLYEGGPGIRTISGTAGFFGTYAADSVTAVGCFFSEFLGAAMLVIGILTATDKKTGLPQGLAPLVIFFTFLGIGVALGMETGFAINPARDLGPRILTAMVGYGKAVFDFRNQYWLWCPVLGSILGMQAGALAYDTLLYTGPDSIVNIPDAEARRRHLEECSQQGNKGSAGMDAV